ncbi:MAG: carbamoyl phosphate synthase small subunit [Oscillospiraceae bacterium]|jgi:carbamoyl-phosphate synthase small subunit|nr:carbamoyl phosphate synthase small subunit [Oscillospiraceae bacterium]
MFNLSKKAYLLLADGTIYEGNSFGAVGTAYGEVVFTTGLTGYQETLTDPSYYGQLVAQTFPLIGNYGVNLEDFESNRSQVGGYIVREWCNMPSNFRSKGNIDDFLKKQNIIGLHSIDTRSLTRKIREHGVMNGVITNENVRDENVLQQLRSQIMRFRIENSVENTTCKEIEIYGSQSKKYTVVLMDYGYKHNIRRELEKRDCQVVVMPANTDFDTIMSYKPNGIMLSNGPGNPEDNIEIIETLKKLCKTDIPIFGICLGHQLMCLANGGRTTKLKYGHRGANQPVIDLYSGKTYVTSQNHGYSVMKESISKEIGVVSHINANDNTCEGVRYKNCNAFTVQFHPEAHGGPLDTTFLFDEFIEKL